MGNKIMLNIDIKTIPHDKQRYPTVGDWIFKSGKLSEILVSDLGNPDYEFLVGLHELVEAYLCSKFGISQEDVDVWDVDYEGSRKAGLEAPCGCKITATSEPGHDRHAPYGKFHIFAEKIERLVAKKSGVKWLRYESKIKNL